jgi:hypothetical protein
MKSGVMSAIDDNAPALSGSYPPHDAAVTVVRDGQCEASRARYARDRPLDVLAYAYARAPNGAWLAVDVRDDVAVELEADVRKYAAHAARSCGRLQIVLLPVAASILARRRALLGIRAAVNDDAARARLAVLALFAHNPALRPCVSTEDAVRMQCAMLFRNANAKKADAKPKDTKDAAAPSLSKFVQHVTAETRAAVEAHRAPYTYLFEAIFSIQVFAVLAILFLGDGEGIFFIVSNWECLLEALYKALASAIEMHQNATLLRIVARVVSSSVPPWMLEHVAPSGSTKALVAGVVARLWEHLPLPTSHRPLGVDDAAREAFGLDESSPYNEPCEAVAWMLGLMRHYTTIVGLHRLTTTMCVRDGGDIGGAVEDEEALRAVQSSISASAPASVRRLEAWCPALFGRLVRYGLYGACLMYNGKSATTTRALLEFILRSESPVMFAALAACSSGKKKDPSK